MHFIDLSLINPYLYCPRGKFGVQPGKKHTDTTMTTETFNTCCLNRDEESCYVSDSFKSDFFGINVGNPDAKLTSVTLWCKNLYQMSWKELKDKESSHSFLSELWHDVMCVWPYALYPHSIWSLLALRQTDQIDESQINRPKLLLLLTSISFSCSPPPLWNFLCRSANLTLSSGPPPSPPTNILLDFPVLVPLLS